MFRILLIEDEDIIRKGLRVMIENMNLPISDIMEASDGEEALECVFLYKPDIIITDIKMPKKDGLELIENYQSLGIHAKYVLISGYGEFTYAQRAISLGVTEYILKPIKNEKLLSVIQKLMQQIEEDRKLKHLENEKSIRLSKVLSELQEKSMKDFCEGTHAVTGALNLLKSADITYKYTHFIVLALHIGVNLNYQCLMEWKQRISTGFKFKKLQYHLFVNQYGKIIFIINFDDADIEDFLGEFLEYVTKTLDKQHKDNLAIGVSRTYQDLLQLPELYNQAIQALDHRLLRWKSITHYFAVPSPERALFPSFYTEKLVNAVEKAFESEILESIESIFKYILNMDYIAPAYIKQVFQGIITKLEFQQTELLQAEIQGIYTLKVEEIYQNSQSLAHFKDKITEYLLSFTKSIGIKDDYINSSVVNNAIKFISRNYHTDISLNKVSNFVSMNPNYFSTLFKAKTGHSFVAYVQNLRIERSKSLLLDPSNRVYEIARKVGFNDETYFSNVFKKITGMTPNEYKTKGSI